MTKEQYITLRLEAIERTLATRSVHAVADQSSLRIAILPTVGDVPTDMESLRESVRTAPSIELSEDELLSENYLDIALRRATGLLAISA